jgi:hypothetical protein
VARPFAGCQVVPPSVDTSTPPTCPPTSEAVPLIVTVLPLVMLASAAGEVTVEAGAVWSVEVVAAFRSLCNVSGWTFMSASRLIVACRMLGSGAVGAPSGPSWTASSPHDHCTVPPPKTSAPLGAR